MNKYKVVVYAISKNEEKFVDRWINSMNEADEIYVSDTGSSDNTVRLLEKRGANVQQISVSPWRFDTARNISLDFVPEDADICVCTDLDEVFEKGWRSLVEQSWQSDTTRLKYMYTWNVNPDGTDGTTFLYEKIHARNGFKWVHPVHEILKYFGEKPDKYSINEDIHLRHYPDNNKSRGQYLELLELSVAENPENDRNMHYLGREYMFRSMWDKSIETLKRHLSLESALWKDERAASMRYISRCYKKKGDLNRAEKWLYRAIAEAPHLREGYIELALLEYDRKNWLMSYAMINEALKISSRPTSYINEDFCWNFTPYDIASICCYNIGLYGKSLEFSRQALMLSPRNKRLKNNLDILEKLVKEGS